MYGVLNGDPRGEAVRWGVAVILAIILAPLASRYSTRLVRRSYRDAKSVFADQSMFIARVGPPSDSSNSWAALPPGFAREGWVVIAIARGTIHISDATVRGEWSEYSLDTVTDVRFDRSRIGLARERGVRFCVQSESDENAVFVAPYSKTSFRAKPSGDDELKALFRLLAG